ncbi:hypothetical protein KPH14_013099 [Odynerus spinipes]|uniref:Uncharacterized protein n=1 Tax=Odynerus spinipes TaxID=1348599 RepID=A0AAD9R864_9HYME|nr:hypothetical protein KPH14_013099 [Odynerus spinipes]
MTDVEQQRVTEPEKTNETETRAAAVVTVIDASKAADTNKEADATTAENTCPNVGGAASEGKKKKQKKSNAMKRPAVANQTNGEKTSTTEEKVPEVGENDGGSPKKKAKISTVKGSTGKSNSKTPDVAPDVNDKLEISAKPKENQRKGGKKRSAKAIESTDEEARECVRVDGDDKVNGDCGDGGDNGNVDVAETAAGPTKKKKRTTTKRSDDDKSAEKKSNSAKSSSNNDTKKKRKKINNGDFDFVLTDENLEKIGAMSETECRSNESCFFEIERHEKLKNDAFIKVIYLKAPESIVLKGKNMHRINFNGYFSFHDKKTRLQVYNYESLTVDRGIEIVPFYLANDETKKSFAITLWNRGEDKCELLAGERIAVLVAQNY